MDRGEPSAGAAAVRTRGDHAASAARGDRRAAERVRAGAATRAGARNPYGHPDAGVVARLAEAGAETYRTDRDGALIFETDGETLTVTRWATRRVDRFCLAEAIC